YEDQEKEEEKDNYYLSPWGGQGTIFPGGLGFTNGVESANIRLVDGPDAMNGRVEVNINGVWGTVCDDFFRDAAASVVCGQLGLPTYGAIAIGKGYFGTGSGPILLDDVDCLGTESTITNCLYTKTHN
ncbi:hypothetical protein CHS0354_022397, partial [Potamilus streckersoni]